MPGFAAANGQQLLTSGFNAVNAIVAQALSNPLALLTAPVSAPITLSSQLGQKVQTGSLTPKATNITVPISGGYIALQPTGTLVSAGQLYNNSASTVGITTVPPGSTTPDPNSAIPVAPGATFNFGSIDLGTIYFGNMTNLSPAQVKLYSEG